MEKLRLKDPGALSQRAREAPELAPDAVDLYLAFQRIDRDERGELLTTSILALLERGMRIDPASAEGQRADRFWREMRRIERDFWEKERKRKKKDADEAQSAKGRRSRRQLDDDEE